MLPGPWELIIIFLIVLLIFGAKRIPDIMGGIGKGIKSFKKNLDADDELPKQSPASTAPPKETIEPK